MNNNQESFSQQLKTETTKQISKSVPTSSHVKNLGPYDIWLVYGVNFDGSMYKIDNDIDNRVILLSI